MEFILSYATRRWGNKVCTTDTALTYRELAERAANGASWCVDQGLGVGSHVAIIAANSSRVMEWHYICANIGAVVVNINPQWTPSKTREVLESVNISLVVCSREYLELGQVANTPVVCLDTHPAGVCSHDADVARCDTGSWTRTRFDASLPYQLYFTSGTTGTPKQVYLTRDIVFTHAVGTADEMRFEESDRWFHLSPMFHLVDIFAIFSITMRGGSHVFPEPGEQNIDLIQKHRVTCFNCASTSMLMLAHSYRDQDVSSLRIISCGGSPLSGHDVRKVMDTFAPAEFFCSYGMTECCGKISMSILPPSKRLDPIGNIDCITTSGRPYQLMDVRITDPDASGVGEIQIRGPTVFGGYHGLDRTEHFAGEWFRTGDLGKWEQHGYLTVVDRKKSMILVGGENVYPVEVEKIVSTFAGVEFACAFAVPDRVLDQRVMLAVTSTVPDFDLDGLKAFCADKLSTYERPKDIVVLPDMPKTASGKIRRNVVQASVVGAIGGCYRIDMVAKQSTEGAGDASVVCIGPGRLEGVPSRTPDSTPADQHVLVVLDQCTDDGAAAERAHSNSALALSALQKFNTCTLVTQNGYSDPTQSCVIAMFRVAQSEKRSASLRILNFDGTRDFRASYLHAEQECEATIRDGATLVPRLRPQPYITVDTPAAPDIVVLTGPGALGVEMTRWLLAETQCKVVWSCRRRRATELDVLQVVGQPMADVVATAEAHYGHRVQCIVHLAGALDDKSIAGTSVDDMRRIMQPKVDLTMDVLSADVPSIVLFSSIYSVIGQPNLVHYGAANGFLDGLQHRPNVQVINWGTWDSAGMASNLGSGFKQYWESRGMQFLDLQRTIRWFYDFVLCNPDNSDGLVVAPSDWDTFSRVSRSTQCIFHDLLQVGPSRPTTTPAPAPVSGSCLIMDTIERIANVKVPSSEAHLIDEVGIDSIMSIEIVEALSGSLGHTLPPTFVSDYTTVARMRAYAQKQGTARVQPTPVAPTAGKTRAHSIVEEVLGRPVPSDDAHLVEVMGLDSIQAIEVVERLSRVAGDTLPPTLLQECPTIAAINARLGMTVDVDVAQPPAPVASAAASAPPPINVPAASAPVAITTPATDLVPATRPPTGCSHDCAFTNVRAADYFERLLYILQRLELSRVSEVRTMDHKLDAPSLRMAITRTLSRFAILHTRSAFMGCGIVRDVDYQVSDILRVTNCEETLHDALHTKLDPACPLQIVLDNAGDASVLHVVYDHAIMDGHSVAWIMDFLLASYAAIARRPGAGPVPHADTPFQITNKSAVLRKLPVRPGLWSTMWQLGLASIGTNSLLSSFNRELLREGTHDHASVHLVVPDTSAIRTRATDYQCSVANVIQAAVCKSALCSGTAQNVKIMTVHDWRMVDGMGVGAWSFGALFSSLTLVYYGMTTDTPLEKVATSFSEQTTRLRTVHSILCLESCIALVTWVFHFLFLLGSLVRYRLWSWIFAQPALNDMSVMVNDLGVVRPSACQSRMDVRFLRRRMTAPYLYVYHYILDGDLHLSINTNVRNAQSVTDRLQHALQRI